MNDGAHQGSAPWAAAAAAWLDAFGGALTRRDAAPAAGLFQPDGHWRDVLAFTWGLRTVSGAPSIEDALRGPPAETKPAGFRLHPGGRTPPRKVVRAGTEVVEGFFALETASGPGEGVVRLVKDPAAPGRPRAWTLLTALAGPREGAAPRPNGGEEEHSRDFGGGNRLDKRDKAHAYAGRAPAALVVGAGQAGLSIAARLGRPAPTRSSSTAKRASATTGASATTR